MRSKKTTPLITFTGLSTLVESGMADLPSGSCVIKAFDNRHENSDEVEIGRLFFDRFNLYAHDVEQLDSTQALAPYLELFPAEPDGSHADYFQHYIEKIIPGISLINELFIIDSIELYPDYRRQNIIPVVLQRLLTDQGLNEHTLICLTPSPVVRPQHMPSGLSEISESEHHQRMGYKPVPQAPTERDLSEEHLSAVAKLKAHYARYGFKVLNPENQDPDETIMGFWAGQDIVGLPKDSRARQ